MRFLARFGRAPRTCLLHLSYPRGSSGTGSDDGTNNDARFNQPAGITLDSAGNIFLCDQWDSTIRKLTHAGTNWVVTTIAGANGLPRFSDGTNGDARFFFPQGLTVAGDGTIYVADTANHVIRRVTPAGTNWIVTTIAGAAGVSGSVSGTNNGARLNYPADIVLDPVGNLFVADSESCTIRKVAPAGTNWVVTTIAGALTGSGVGSADGTNFQARFAGPQGIALDNAGNLYVADKSNHTIRRLTPSGTNWVVTTIAGSAGLLGTSDGTNKSARFNHPYQITADNYGALYVTDGDNHTLRAINRVGTNWIVSTLAGSAGHFGTNDGPAAGARFYYPYGLTLDPAGNLYVADLNNGVVRFGEFSPALAGDHAANQFILSWPRLAANYNLEKSTNLSLAAGWASITNGITISSDIFALTNELDSPNGFYRLRMK